MDGFGKKLLKVVLLIVAVIFVYFAYNTLYMEITTYKLQESTNDNKGMLSDTENYKDIISQKNYYTLCFTNFNVPYESLVDAVYTHSTPTFSYKSMDEVVYSYKYTGCYVDKKGTFQNRNSGINCSVTWKKVDKKWVITDVWVDEH